MSQRYASRRLLQEDRGASAVEFALVLTVLLVIVLGVIQFGLIWYTKYALACASREGARYGTLYKTNASGDRIPPSNLTPTIESVVLDYLAKLCPSLSQDKVQVNVSGTGYTTGTAGAELIVTLTAQNPWNLLGPFIPSLNNLTLSAQTTMKCE